MAKSKLAMALAVIGKSKVIDPANRVNTSLALNGMEHISTGCILIDHLIGGVSTANGDLLCPGFPKGRIVEVFGGEGSGKTSICIQAAVRCQRAGGSVLYLDYENAMSLQYAQSLGLDIMDQDSFVLWNPAHFEEGAELISAAINAGVDLIVVDSIAAMVPQKTFENAVSEIGQIGYLARSLSAFFPKIVKPLRAHGSTLVLINQIRARIKTSMYDLGPDEDTSGGKALKFYASVRLKFHPRTKIKSKVKNPLTGDVEEQIHATIVRATCIKNKIAPHQGHTVDVVVRFGSGFDNVQSILDIALKRSMISRAGAWYSWTGSKGDPIKIQSSEKVYDFLKNNPPEFGHLVGQIEGFFNKIETMDTLNLEDKDIIREDIPDLSTEEDDNDTSGFVPPEDMD